jgi:hypothetical protein
MEIITIFGQTGVGKSYYAHNFDPENMYCLPPKKNSGTYWDGYDGQRVVVIDEMTGSQFSYKELLRLLDWTPLSVPVHNGLVNFSSRVIIFTSNYHPDDWYDAEKYPWEEGQPLYRRMTTNGSRVYRMERNRNEERRMILIAGREPEPQRDEVERVEVVEQGEDDWNNNNEEGSVIETLPPTQLVLETSTSRNFIEL